MALLFALGYEQIRKEGYIPKDEDVKDMQTFFEQWQVAYGKSSELKSTILGLELVVETPNNITSFGIAEQVMRRMFPYRERMTIFIVQLEGTPQIRFPDDDSSRVEVKHPVNTLIVLHSTMWNSTISWQMS